MKKQQMYIIGAVVVVLLLLGGFMLLGRQDQQSSSDQTTTNSEDALPTVDASVKVNLKGVNNNKEVILSIAGIPNGTNSIEYELSYATVEGALQGVNSTINLTNNEKSYEKRITLGTCSSGTCVYHNVKGKISVSLKFNGSYGGKIFQKDFGL